MRRTQPCVIRVGLPHLAGHPHGAAVWGSRLLSETRSQRHLRTEPGFHAGHGIAGYGRKVNTGIRYLGYFPVVPASRSVRPGQQ